MKWASYGLFKQCFWTHLVNYSDVCHMSAIRKEKNKIWVNSDNPCRLWPLPKINTSMTTDICKCHWTICHMINFCANKSLQTNKQYLQFCQFQNFDFAFPWNFPFLPAIFRRRWEVGLAVRNILCAENWQIVWEIWEIGFLTFSPIIYLSIIVFFVVMVITGITIIFVVAVSVFFTEVYGI